MSSIKRVMDANRARAEIKRRMAKFAEEAPKEVTDQMMATAGEIAVGMRQIVQVKTGELKKSIGHGFQKDMPSDAVFHAKGKFGTHNVFIWAGSKIAYYARWVEFGTQSAGPRKKGINYNALNNHGVRQGHRATAAHPFFWPVWRAWKKEAKKDMRRAYKKVGERVFGGKV